NAFIESEPYIRNQESYLSLFITRLILRNLIIFAHNVIVFLPIALIFHTSVNLNTLLLLPGLIIISLNALLWGSLLAVIGTRYRDFAQIITSLIQVIFFLTPIMWMPTLLPAKLNWVVMYNPFNQLLNLIRYPLLGQALTLPSILMITTVTLLGLSLYTYCLGKYKNRVVFWL
ncbi:MAG TPA: ABC transporter, partial [Legionellales bacterium]|nr:ABC transporter [Legionellales bacterium]